MGSIILPNQWARQPQYPAPLNLNGFCRDVGFVYLPNIGYVDLANKVTFSVITELTSRAGNNQIGGYPTSGTGYANTGPTNFSLGYTLFAVCSASGTASEAIMDDDLGGTRGFQFRFNNTGGINFIPFTNADGFASVNSNNYSAEELARGVPVIGRVDAAGNIAVFGKGGKFTGSLGAAPRIPGNVPGNTGIRFFRWKGGGNQLTKPLFMAGALNRVVSDVEAFAFLENPWKQVFAPQQRRIWVPSAGGGGVNGTLSQTLDNVTSSATGTVLLQGTLSRSLDAATLLADGVLVSPVVGELDKTLGTLVSTATGTVLIQGTLSQTLDATTLASTGELTQPGSGTLSQTLGNATLSATSTLALKGTASVNLDALGLNATSAILVKGVLTQTLENTSLLASGGELSGVSGVLSQTLENLVLSAAGGGLWSEISPSTTLWAEVTPSSTTWTEI